MISDFLYFFFINMAKIISALLLFASFVFPIFVTVQFEWSAWWLLLYIPILAVLLTLNDMFQSQSKNDQ